MSLRFVTRVDISPIGITTVEVSSIVTYTSRSISKYKPSVTRTKLSKVVSGNSGSTPSVHDVIFNSVSGVPLGVLIENGSIKEIKEYADCVQSKLLRVGLGLGGVLRYRRKTSNGIILTRRFLEELEKSGFYTGAVTIFSALDLVKTNNMLVGCGHYYEVDLYKSSRNLLVFSSIVERLLY